MSDPRLDALAEAARNRGLKLVRSRVRTPGKRRFGKVGLTDASDKPMFGMDAKGPTAKPDEAEAYLRSLGAQDWGASLDVAEAPRKPVRSAATAPASKPAKTRSPANDRAPAAKLAPKRVPKPKPRPAPPKPAVRDAKPADAGAAVALAAVLGAELDEKDVRKRIAALTKEGSPPLIATLGKEVVGLCAFGRIATHHRARPTGHETMLAVSEQARRRGIGRMLIEAAEAKLAKLGCGHVEIAVGDARIGAQAFYRTVGYERTSIRFAKDL